MTELDTARMYEWHRPSHVDEFGEICDGCAEQWPCDAATLLAEVGRLRSQLDDARGIAGRLEKELDDKSQAVVRVVRVARNSGYSLRYALNEIEAIFAGPSSVAEFEALGTPVEDKK